MPTKKRKGTRVSPRKRAPATSSRKILEVFENPNSSRDYSIHMEIPEFTCLCPRTGQPDFATITLDYIPDQVCVELKSLKLYMVSFRDRGAFHEAVTNEIADDLVALLKPRMLTLNAEFNVRGGIYTSVNVQHLAKGFQPPVPSL